MDANMVFMIWMFLGLHMDDFGTMVYAFLGGGHLPGRAAPFTLSLVYY